MLHLPRARERLGFLGARALYSPTSDSGTVSFHFIFNFIFMEGIGTVSFAGTLIPWTRGSYWVHRNPCFHINSFRLLEPPPQLPGSRKSSSTQNPISFRSKRFSLGHSYPTRARFRIRGSGHCCVREKHNYTNKWSSSGVVGGCFFKTIENEEKHHVKGGWSFF